MIRKILIFHYFVLLNSLGGHDKEITHAEKKYAEQSFLIHSIQKQEPKHIPMKSLGDPCTPGEHITKSVSETSLVLVNTMLDANESVFSDNSGRATPENYQRTDPGPDYQFTGINL